MKKKYLILSICLSFVLAFVLPAHAQAQNFRTVNGTVVSESNEPVIGASVIVVGTTKGTTSGTDGKFSIDVPTDGKLSISFVGYIPITVSDFSKTRFVLVEDALEMEQVVVVGYGAQKAKHLTGAVSVLDPEEIKDFATGDLASALQGQIPGLGVSGGLTRPGMGASLSIRQTKESNAYSASSDGNSPLYVIDDYVSDETQFNNLNPNEIESISVLKDGAAAVYGVRAAQGVILIKTKRGKVGEPKISYQGQFGFTDAVSKPKMLSAYDYGVLWNATSKGGDRNVTDFNESRELFQYEELQAMKKLNYDLLDDEWSAGFTQRHSVNISGGTEKATYFGSVSYFNQDGNIGKLDYDRWNYRAGMDTKIGKWMKASLQVSGNYGKKNTALNKLGQGGAETDYNLLLTNPRYIPAYVDGKPILRYGISNASKHNVQKYHYDAAQDANSYSESTPQSMNINTSLEYDFGWSRILKGLKIRASYAKSIDTDKTNELATEYTLYSMTNRGSAGLGSDYGHLYTGDDVDLSINNFVAHQISTGKPNGEGDSYLRREMRRTDNYQMNLTATYARTFGLHDISGLFSIEKSEREYEFVWGQKMDPYDFTDEQSNSATGKESTQFSRSESGTLSYVGRINYAYADKYLFEFLLRSDASTRFAPENYWGYFPSVSLGWVISEEDWFKNNVGAINFLKIRGSFGLTGKDNINAWAWLQTYGVDAYKYGAIFGTNVSNPNGPGIMASDSPNRDAHWDKNYKTNLGVDLRAFKSRFSVTMDFYYEMGREMFSTRAGASTFPGTVGSLARPDNWGEMDMWGIELALGWKDKVGDFSYFVNVNTGFSDNKVKKRHWGPIQNLAIDKNHPNKRTDTGLWGLECLGMFRSYQQIEEYFAQNNITNYLGKGIKDIHPGMLIYKDVRGERNPDGSFQEPDGIVHKEQDLIRISRKSGNPYGFTMNFGGSWKNLSLKAQLNVSWGSYSMMNEPMRGVRNITGQNGWAGMEYTNLPVYWANNMYTYSDVYDAQGNLTAAQNRTAKYPNLRYEENMLPSTFWKISGTRVTLRNITLAYSVPSRLINKLGIESCRINFTGQNLFSLYNPYPKNFIDPMSSYYNYPKMRAFNVGVNVSF